MGLSRDTFIVMTRTSWEWYREGTTSVVASQEARHEAMDDDVVTSSFIDARILLGLSGLI